MTKSIARSTAARTRCRIAGHLTAAGALSVIAMAAVAGSEVGVERPAAAVEHSAGELAVRLASAAAAESDEGTKSAGAESTSPAPTSGDTLTPSPIPSRPVVYRPPLRGSPRGKVGAGVRGALWLPLPQVLAPDHLALTAQGAPSLFWYVAGAVPEGVRVVFSLVDPERPEPLAEVELPRPTAPGIQRIRLDPLGVALEPEVECEWTVALVSDAAERDLDLVSAASIVRVAPPDLGDGVADAARLAELGLWYDALESLQDAVESHPGDAFVHQQRAALLRQGGLPGATSEP